MGGLFGNTGGGDLQAQMSQVQQVSFVGSCWVA